MMNNKSRLEKHKQMMLDGHPELAAETLGFRFLIESTTEEELKNMKRIKNYEKNKQYMKNKYKNKYKNDDRWRDSLDNVTVKELDNLVKMAKENEEEEKRCRKGIAFIDNAFKNGDLQWRRHTDNLEYLKTEANNGDESAQKLLYTMMTAAGSYN